MENDSKTDSAVIKLKSNEKDVNSSRKNSRTSDDRKSLTQDKCKRLFLSVWMINSIEAEPEGFIT